MNSRDTIDKNLKPIDSNRQWVTFNYMKPILKKIKKHKALYMCDVSPISEKLHSKQNGIAITKEWNHNITLKKQKSLMNLILRANRKYLIMLIVYIPLVSLCSISSPISVRKFTQILIPSTFYNCDDLFTDNPAQSQFIQLNYRSGLEKVLVQLWGFLILSFVSQVANFALQNLAMSGLIRAATISVSGLLDMIFNKILVISDQTRSSSASGNITNLLYTDSMTISTLIVYFHFIIQIPTDLVIYIIYMGVQINPLALIGLTAYLVIFPVVGLIMGKVQFIQKKLMSLKDMRMKRATEILNGIKIVKLFGLESVQYARLQNTRNKELKQLFYFAVCFSVFGLIASATAPIMTAIAFIVMTFKDKFDITSAFTIMFLFQFLAFAIIMLPMIMSSASQAAISAKRISAFLQLAETDPGIVVKVNELNQEERKKLPDEAADDSLAIVVTGKPSFTWNLAQDKIVPPVMDPFFKENKQALAQIKRNLPMELKRYKVLLGQHRQSYQIQPAIEYTGDITHADLQQLDIALTKESKDILIDRWCIQFDVPLVSRIQSLEQYNFTNYVPDKNSSEVDQLKLMAIHIQTMRHYLNKNNNVDVTDGPAVVKNLKLKVKKGDIIGVCGQVGQGKTSFFNAILGEMRLIASNRDKLNTYISKDGLQPIYNDYDLEKKHQEDPRFDSEIPHIYVNGTTAYFSQACHIFSKSARQNILFNKPYDAEKYKRVVEMCCLKDDFAILPAGDQTEVGGKGVTLSGGQKARLSLARAIYSDANIYLLDDPLSAVDAHVGKTIWNDAILGYLKSRGATVIIASHQTHYFNDCDKIIQITDGEIINYETVQNLMKDNIKIMGITGKTSMQHSHANMATIKNEDVLKVQDIDASKGKNTESQKEEELTTTGNIKLETYKKWFTSGSLVLGLLTIILYAISTAITQYQTVMVSHWATDKYGWVKTQSNMELNITDCGIGNTLQSSYCAQNAIYQIIINGLDPAKDVQQMIERVQVILSCAKDKNIKYSMSAIKSSNNYLWLYIGLTFGIIVFTIVANIAYGSFCLSVSKKLHSNMLTSVLNTKLSFFDTTPQGRIMNRFSKDTLSVDSEIMFQLQGAFSSGLTILGMIISIAIVNYPCIVVIFVAIVIFITIFFNFRKLYPQMKRLEAASRSPVFSICQETVDSLVSIRAFSLQEKQKYDFREAVDFNSSLLFQQYSLRQWLVFRLGVLSGSFALLIALVATLIAPYSGEISKYTGVIVSYGFSISYILMNFVLTMVTLDGEMSAVERLIEYGGLQQEGEFVKRDFKLASDWPRNNSGIEVKNLQFRYRPELDLVLKKLDFKLKPKEHIGIVGRTGAGKSSITMAMYRLAEPDKGSQIIVDGVNILDLGLHQARKAFTIIPQDPFLFSGTLRQCLCPYSQADAEGVKTEGLERIDDKRMWEALEQVQMKEYFQKQPGQLDSKISTNGDNLSAGQKQLVCIARAILRKASCVILDEATAQVDRENDQLIQQTIRNAFSEVTVLSIAHRLDTIIDFDRIIVMDKGNIAEFDTPANLIRKEGVFFELVNNTGTETSEKLKTAAFQAEKQRQVAEKVNNEID
ncbi:Xenobiotic-transporting_ATPase / Multidrug resistance-associated protein [Hexamita inflata]|uniref:Xenobiotic-transporting ATPase / Multidrug resistance-associated protein n=1 Tax=Hexamita inflata TaxID=28002 RepID=A0AA86PXP3_9EUKA|nr:Xenobiotic-transporting ATPase / Multidrug resistance-associated protein [Hexamita inflata]